MNINFELIFQPSSFFLSLKTSFHYYHSFLLQMHDHPYYLFVIVDNNPIRNCISFQRCDYLILHCLEIMICILLPFFFSISFYFFVLSLIIFPFLLHFITQNVLLFFFFILWIPIPSCLMLLSCCLSLLSLNCYFTAKWIQEPKELHWLKDISKNINQGMKNVK